MATLNLSMPKTMREWIDAQIKAGEYANASDYRLSRYLPLPGCSVQIVGCLEIHPQFR